MKLSVRLFHVSSRTAAAVFWGAGLMAGASHAQVMVSEPWVRATVPQQRATGLFASVTSVQGGRLLAASSGVAEVVEIHEMAMDGNVMKMRAIPALDLPPGQSVELRPGGYHVMLLGLKQQIKEGDTVPVTLVVETRDGKRQNVDVKATARALNRSQPGQGAAHSTPPAAPPGSHRH